MKIILTIILHSLFISLSVGQSIKEIIEQVNLDSLTKTVRELSGEDSTFINGNLTIINHRVNYYDYELISEDAIDLRQLSIKLESIDSLTRKKLKELIAEESVNNYGKDNNIFQKVNYDGVNDLTADYLKEKLLSYNLDVTDVNYSEFGRNIYAMQTGSLYPDSIYIICAHYDAVHSYCADDNASGSAAVLEAARILSKICTEHTIIYAFWDDEEHGKLGSRNFAHKAEKNNLNILGVLNLDMIGYDGNDDNIYEIHTNDFPGSISLTNSLNNFVKNYNLNLVTSVKNTPAMTSDHSSFWITNYDAVCITEAYYGNDFNPYYYTTKDRISLFDMSYFLELSKLTIGTVTSLAKPCHQNSNN